MSGSFPKWASKLKQAAFQQSSPMASGTSIPTVSFHGWILHIYCLFGQMASVLGSSPCSWFGFWIEFSHPNAKLKIAQSAIDAFDRYRFVLIPIVLYGNRIVYNMTNRCSFMFSAWRHARHIRGLVPRWFTYTADVTRSNAYFIFYCLSHAVPCLSRQVLLPLHGGGVTTFDDGVELMPPSTITSVVVVIPGNVCL